MTRSWPAARPGLSGAAHRAVAGEAELAAVRRHALEDDAADALGERRLAGAVEHHLGDGGLAVEALAAGLVIDGGGEAIEIARGADVADQPERRSRRRRGQRRGRKRLDHIVGDGDRRRNRRPRGGGVTRLGRLGQGTDASLQFRRLGLDAGQIGAADGKAEKSAGQCGDKQRARLPARGKG